MCNVNELEILVATVKVFISPRAGDRISGGVGRRAEVIRQADETHFLSSFRCSQLLHLFNSIKFRQSAVDLNLLLAEKPGSHPQGANEMSGNHMD